jgi:hypothetical protein
MMMVSAGKYRVEVDRVSSAAWPDVAARFDDASLFQTWNWRDGQDVSRLTLSDGGELVAASEVRLFTLPVLRGGIAYVFWGPLWRRRGEPADLDVFRHAIRALIAEYVERRGMVLRINPRLFQERDQDALAILAAEGFEPVEGGAVRRTLVADISGDLADIRSGLEKKWRNCLSKAERSGLTVDSGPEIERFDEFRPLYDQLLERKQLQPSADFDRHRDIQTRLPEAARMRTVLARHDGRPCAGAIYSALGDTAIYLFGAIDETGMKTSASYLVQWTVIEELKARGVRGYDLNGVNAEANPGTYHFKRGLAGKVEPELTCAGQMQLHRGSLTNESILFLDRLRLRRRASRDRQVMAAQ